MSSGNSKPLLVVGSINTDLVLRVDRLPAAGETISASSMETFPGGKARRALRHYAPLLAVYDSKGSAFNNKNRQEVAKCWGASQGANQAAAAARLGYPTSFYGQVTLHLCLQSSYALHLRFLRVCAFEGAPEICTHLFVDEHIRFACQLAAHHCDGVAAGV